jgi:Na+/phosphate symporter
MPVLLNFLGVLQIIGGIAVALSAKSAIHEILGSIAFGMGVLALGLAAILSRLSDLGSLKAASEKQAELFQSIMDSRKT